MFQCKRNNKHFNLHESLIQFYLKNTAFSSTENSKFEVTGLVVELDDQGESVCGDELGQLFGVGERFGVGQIVAAFIELLEEDDCVVGLDLVLGEEGGLGGDCKLLIVHCSGDILESLGGGSFQILKIIIKIKLPFNKILQSCTVN